MIVIQSLYQPAPKDLAGLSLEWWSSYVTDTQAAPQLSTYLGNQLPLDRLLCITHCAMQLTTGSAQFPTRFELIEQFADASVSTDRLIATRDFVRPPPAAAAIVAETFPLLYFARPGSYILAQSIFDAGAAANAHGVTVSGYLIPRGNIQFAG